ncbi:hypothetical protein HMPREF9093_01290 [Fusobacterium sp. oral taxon 370 str. F0437]|nr:hypothetical protein HMPREF9093_01290 [Fusobacterium sp. oral taxon 370 str. F0437]
MKTAILNLILFILFLVISFTVSSILSSIQKINFHIKKRNTVKIFFVVG